MIMLYLWSPSEDLRHIAQILQHVAFEELLAPSY